MYSTLDIISGGVAGGTFLALVVALWGYLKGGMSYFRGIFIDRIILNDWDIIYGIHIYCNKHFWQLRFGDSKYYAKGIFVNTVNKYIQVAFENTVWGTKLYMHGWIPLLLCKTDDGDAIVYIIRKSFDKDKLIAAAIDEYNKSADSNTRKKSSHIVKLFGSGANININQNGSMPEVSCDEYDIVGGTGEIANRLLGWEREELGYKSKTDNPLTKLAFPEHVWDYVKEITRWKFSKDWYIDKQIPWKRGWLLHGKPGTGKTSLVRAMGEYLDMPIFVFNLSTFDDKEFAGKWEIIRKSIPCIVLMEDIDTVFEGRTNICQNGGMQRGLSFECVLNIIDGVENSDGIFTVITTNHVGKLDEALIGVQDNDGIFTGRPGRIDRIIKLDYIDKEGMMIMAKRILADCPEHIDDMVAGCKNITPAYFQEQCELIALREYWRTKENV